jgi:acyl-CoA thioester hydrolase
VPVVESILYELPMRYSDLDPFKHVNNVRYIDFAAEAQGAMTDAGQLSSEAVVVRAAVEFRRPMLPSKRPVTVMSTLEGDVLTQDICSGTPEVPIVYAQVRTTFGPTRRRLSPHDGGTVLPLRLRRTDADGSGFVGAAKMFEIIQEGRNLFASSHRTAMATGGVVMGRGEIVFDEPLRWRPEPYPIRTWISRIGDGSVTIEAEIAEGDTVYVRSTSVQVGFDAATQKSRKFSEEEKAQFVPFTLRG